MNHIESKRDHEGSLCRLVAAPEPAGLIRMGRSRSGCKEVVAAPGGAPELPTARDRHAKNLSVWLPTSLLFAAALTIPCVHAPAQELAAAAQQLQTEEGVSVPYPRSWSLAPERYKGIYELLRVPSEALGTPASMGAPMIMISTEQRRDHVEALARLRGGQAYGTPDELHMQVQDLSEQMEALTEELRRLTEAQAFDRKILQERAGRGEG